MKMKSASWWLEKTWIDTQAPLGFHLFDETPLHNAANYECNLLYNPVSWTLLYLILISLDKLIPPEYTITFFKFLPLSSPWLHLNFAWYMQLVMHLLMLLIMCVEPVRNVIFSNNTCRAEAMRPIIYACAHSPSTVALSARSFSPQGCYQ